jgi:hypothetical protein
MAITSILPRQKGVNQFFDRAKGCAKFGGVAPELAEPISASAMIRGCQANA